MLVAYSIEDTKAALYNTPFFMRSNGEALRAFQDLANNKETRIGMHPEDYRLWAIGTFEDDTGKLVQFGEPMLLGRADDYVAVRAVPLGVVKESA